MPWPRPKRGTVICVFETTDSIQHMFWRYLDKSHPALQRRPSELSPQVIEDLYKKMDDLIGRVRARLDSRSALIVMSDHGFKSFRRGVNLNSWLYLNGYLKLKEGKTSERRMVQGCRLGDGPKPMRWGSGGSTSIKKGGRPAAS